MECFLNLAHAEENYGFQVPGYYSWGGHCAYNATIKKYVAFFAFMVNHCTLSTWTTNSEIIMTTADEPHGPYDNINYKPIVAPWSHNPYLVNYTNPKTGKTQWQIWHIGNGLNNTNPKNCTSSNPVDSNTTYEPHSGDTNSSFFIEISNDGLFGPWSQYDNDAQIILNDTWVCSKKNIYMH